MTDLFNRHFGEPVTVAQMTNFLRNHKLRNGRDTRFRPGRISPNKGIKGVWHKGSEATWFKKGSRPASYMPVGSERVNGDGYVQVKISDRKKQAWKRWKSKSVILWEAHHGKVPKGHAIIFADGNKLNLALDNLLLVSRAELAVMNNKRLISTNRELTLAGKAVADIKLLIAKRKAVKPAKKRRGRK